MCGIAGWFGPGAEHLYEDGQGAAALHQLRQRGPDHTAQWHAAGIWLGHTRLSILDTTAAAHQPMTSEDGRYVITFNGEIYNYRELRTELQAAGYAFHTSGDTEVLLNAFRHWDASCLPRLNGFFAFAVVDRQRERLVLARDRYGIKPLLYTHGKDEVGFASEAKALFALGHPPKPDLRSLGLYLQLGYVPPQHSLIQGAHHLRPGHYIELPSPASAPEPVCYYQLAEVNAAGCKALPADYKARRRQLDEHLAAAVEKRLVSDVPLGVFLSGGIDSSVVAAYAARQKTGLKTFSIGFDNPLYDETHYAQLVAKHIGSEHHVFKLSMEEIYAHLEEVLNYIDEPFADSSALNLYLLSKYTRQHVSVALSGDGADELFGGYSKHLAEANARRQNLLNTALKAAAPLTRLPLGNQHSKLGRKVYQARKYAHGLRQSDAERYWTWAAHTPERDALALLQPDVRAQLSIQPQAAYLQRFQQESDLNDVLRTDLELVLPGDMLRKVDLMSMANSLEVRVPFLDHELVDYVNRLPADDKVHGSYRKFILQDLSRQLLPAELFNRPKQGFEVPLRDWFTGPMRNRIETELLNEERLRAQGIFEPAALRKLWQQVQQGGRGKETWTLWNVLVFQSSWERWFGGSTENMSS